MPIGAPTVLSSLMKAVPAAPRAMPGPPPPGAGGAGAPPSPMGLPPGGGIPPNIIAEIINKRLSQSQGADPGYFMGQLQKMKVIVAEMIPKATMRFGGVDKHLTKILTALDQAIKETESAQSQANVAGGPIDMSAALTGAGGPPMAGAPPFGP